MILAQELGGVAVTGIPRESGDDPASDMVRSG